jgi:hypothetical protein
MTPIGVVRGQRVKWVVNLILASFFKAPNFVSEAFTVISCKVWRSALWQLAVAKLLLLLTLCASSYTVWNKLTGYITLTVHIKSLVCLLSYYIERFSFGCLSIRINSKYFLNFLTLELLFLILAQPVYKIWIIQEPNTLDLWNKLHFEEKKRRVYTMFKIYSTHICWINI